MTMMASWTDWYENAWNDTATPLGIARVVNKDTRVHVHLKLTSLLPTLFLELALNTNRSTNTKSQTLIVWIILFITWWFYINNFIGYHAVTWHSVKFYIVWLKLVLTWFHFRFLTKSIKRIMWIVFLFDQWT
jgi:hypothetical protein